MGTNHSRHISAAVRREVTARSSGCFYCGVGVGPFEFDHFTPVRLGGSNSEDNVVLACVSCNRAKGSLSPSTYLRRSAAKLERKAQAIREAIHDPH